MVAVSFDAPWCDPSSIGRRVWVLTFLTLFDLLTTSTIPTLLLSTILIFFPPQSSAPLGFQALRTSTDVLIDVALPLPTPPAPAVP